MAIPKQRPLPKLTRAKELFRIINANRTYCRRLARMTNCDRGSIARGKFDKVLNGIFDEIDTENPQIRRAYSRASLCSNLFRFGTWVKIDTDRLNKWDYSTDREQLQYDLDWAEEAYTKEERKLANTARFGAHCSMNKEAKKRRLWIEVEAIEAAKKCLKDYEIEMSDPGALDHAKKAIWDALKRKQTKISRSQEQMDDTRLRAWTKEISERLAAKQEEALKQVIYGCPKTKPSMGASCYANSGHYMMGMDFAKLEERTVLADLKPGAIIECKEEDLQTANARLGTQLHKQIQDYQNKAAWERLYMTKWPSHYAGLKADSIIMDEVTLTKEERPMEIKTQTLIDGSPADSMDDSTIIHHIGNLENRIEKRSKLKTESTRITADIEKMRGQCKELAAILDARTD